MLLAVVDVACLDGVVCIAFHYKTAVKPHVLYYIITLYYETACFLCRLKQLCDLSAYIHLITHDINYLYLRSLEFI